MLVTLKGRINKREIGIIYYRFSPYSTQQQTKWIIFTASLISL